MCGIAGFFNLKRSSDTFSDLVLEMLSMIQHRGPDEMGYYFDEKIAFGTARLSVVDVLSGQQPISDLKERYWICYTGEVYNYIELRKELENIGYKFNTKSDTEVVLNAYIEWGVKSFDRLNGGFAFAIYDRYENSVVLVRDRYGERPLYYMKRGNELIFASEIKCFLCHKEIKLEFDTEKLRSIFTVWTPLPDQSPYKSLHQVPIGGYIVFKADGHEEIKSYYSLFSNKDKFIGTEKDAVEKIRHELSQSVKIRLRSDVEVGTYLSGGIDSSIVTLLTTKHSKHRVRTFSIGFEDKTFDESIYQKEVSEFLGTDHNSLNIKNEDIVESFPEALWHGEVPVFRTAFVPMFMLSKLVRDSGIKVVLTGEGSDEFFLGYDLFKETLLRSSWDKLTNEEKKRWLQNMNPYEELFQENAPRLMALYEKTTKEQIYRLFSHEIRFNTSSFTARLLSTPGNGLAHIKSYVEKFKSELESLSVLECSQWLESKTMLAGYLLSTQGDRMSFSHGVESRLPFLDPNVVNFACSLPVEFKLNNDLIEKYILKQAFQNELPQSIINKPKHAYRSPDAYAFLHSDNPPDYLALILSESELAKVEFLNKDFVVKLVNKLKNTPQNQISHRENQAFIFLLSTVLLHRNLLTNPVCKPNSNIARKLLVKKVDGRALASMV